MNDGILTGGVSPPPMPCGLLGVPSPAPLPDQAWHPEAADWLARVRENGGSVSGNTMRAVHQFCLGIDAAGIRSRFHRINLICGDSLMSAVVPLYRSRTPRGTVIGGATDTNNNLVSGDYIETGSLLAGIKGNGSNKSFDTGLSPTGIGASSSDFHISAYISGNEAAGTSRMVIGLALSATETFIGWTGLGTAEAAGLPCAAARISQPPGRPGGLLLVTSRAEAGTLYAANVSSNIGGTALPPGNFTSGNILVLTAFGLFSLNRVIRAYSVGVGMSPSDIGLFQRVMQQFQVAMGRAA